MIKLFSSRGMPQYEDFYQQYYDQVVRYINKKISNSYDAQDIAGEVFLYCYKHYGDYDPSKSSLNTWLYLVVNSRVKNYYRDNKVNVDIDELSWVLADERVDMDSCVYVDQVREGLNRAIATLPERQQKIVRMKYFEEKSSSEIAEVLGLSAGNVRVLLSRALDALESQCGDLLEGVN